MTKSEFIEHYELQGWKLDRWGHLHFYNNSGKHFRLKLSRVAVRYEVKSSSDLGWIRIASGYFSRLTVMGNRQVAGWKR